MRRKLLYFLIPVFVLVALYRFGPAPVPPTVPAQPPVVSANLTELESWLQQREKNTPGLKTGNEAHLVWADSTQKKKTPVAFVYIHGFSASGVEGEPVHREIAKRYKANLFIARLAGHGLDLGDQTLGDLTADQLLASAEEALAIGKQIGQQVVVIGTSMGGALTLYLAAHHPEIKSIVLYSPCIEIFDPNAALIDNPWGLYLAQIIKGSEYNDIQPAHPQQGDFWSLHYRLEGVQALQNLLTHVMVPETFQKVTCPVFMGYYYQDEVNQDKVVSVPAMLKMFEQLGSQQKVKTAFPTTKNHVLASYVLSQDYQVVQQGTSDFLDPILLTSTESK